MTSFFIARKCEFFLMYTAPKIGIPFEMAEAADRTGFNANKGFNGHKLTTVTNTLILPLLLLYVASVV